LARSFARLVIPGKTQGIENAGDAPLGQQFLGRPDRQLAPGQEHAAGRADIVAGPRQQDGVAQGRFILDTTSGPRHHRGRGKRQPLPPRAGPPFLPADHRVERTDGGARGDRDVLNPLRAKALRVRNGAAQPSW
jgi:hypothetical protein